MTTILAPSELLRRALQYILDEQAAGTCKSAMELIDEASMRFNLSPVDAETLARLLQKEQKNI